MTRLRPDGLALSNWRQRPFSQWSFFHTRELFPTAAIAAGHTGSALAPGHHATIGETTSELSKLLDATETDDFLVLKGGRPVLRWMAPHSDASGRHLLFSVSKSITALVAGILEGEDRLDFEAPVIRYVPEVAGGAYASATVRHLLDMTVSLDFEEAYLDVDGAFARYRRAMLWNPCPPGSEPEHLLQVLASLPMDRHPHGARYHYASPNSDLLGLVVERAGGRPYASLVAALLWRPMGAAVDADVTLDQRGMARAAGGISAHVADLARIGELLRNGGRANDRQIVPERFVRDLWTGGSRDLWRASEEASPAMPNAAYRSQWYSLGDADDCLCAIGIHGQWIYINPAKAVVIARTASHADPLNDETKAVLLKTYENISNALPD